MTHGHPGAFCRGTEVPCHAKGSNGNRQTLVRRDKDEVKGSDDVGASWPRTLARFQTKPKKGEGDTGDRLIGGDRYEGARLGLHPAITTALLAAILLLQPRFHCAQ